MANFPKTLLVSWVKIQCARDDEGPYSSIRQNKNIDNDFYCSSNEFPNHLAVSTMVIVAQFYTVIRYLRSHVLKTGFFLV